MIECEGGDDTVWWIQSMQLLYLSKISSCYVHFAWH